MCMCVDSINEREREVPYDQSCGIPAAKLRNVWKNLVAAIIPAQLPLSGAVQYFCLYV